MFCCEDHLNLEEDLENYQYFKLMNGIPKLKPSANLHGISETPVRCEAPTLKSLLEVPIDNRPETNITKKQKPVYRPVEKITPTIMSASIDLTQETSCIDAQPIESIQITNTTTEQLMDTTGRSTPAVKFSSAGLRKNTTTSNADPQTTISHDLNDATHLKRVTFRNVDDVVVPNRFKHFLLADYRHDATRITVFCAGDVRYLLCQIEDYLSDGTFKSCPEPYLQLYTIHADLGTAYVPVVYALMSHKDKKSYETLFNIIKSQIPEWKPKTYTTDFDSAAMKAVKKVFPDVIVKGSFYHYTKEVWKKGVEFRLTKCWASKRQVALSAVLPLVPENEILNGWAYIESQCVNNEDSKQFQQYMLNQWIAAKDENFKKSWNSFSERQRTTPFLKSWHRGMNKAIGKKEPTINKLLILLEKDTAFYRQKSNRRTTNNSSNDKFIHRCQMQFMSGEITLGHMLEKLRS